MKKLLLKNGNIYDGKLNSDLLMNYDILIEDGIITSIGQNITNNNAKIIDLKGSYVIPGLINLHVHLPASGKPSKKKVGDLKKLVAFISKYEITRKVGIKICQKNAEKEIKRIDKLRANHYKYYTGKEWNNHSNYDICINSDVLGVEKTADLICELVNEKVRV